MAAGLSGIAPIISAWLANNSEPHYRRATSVALVVLAANAVCFDEKYTIIFHTYFFLYLSGWYFEYLELPNQGWTEIPQHNNYESRVVR